MNIYEFNLQFSIEVIAHASHVATRLVATPGETKLILCALYLNKNTIFPRIESISQNLPRFSSILDTAAF